MDWRSNSLWAVYVYIGWWCTRSAPHPRRCWTPRRASDWAPGRAGPLRPDPADPKLEGSILRGQRQDPAPEADGGSVVRDRLEHSLHVGHLPGHKGVRALENAWWTARDRRWRCARGGGLRSVGRRGQVRPHELGHLARADIIHRGCPD